MNELKQAMVMEIVNKICSNKTDCRGLSNNVELAEQLLAIAGISKDAVITEIPVNWDNQTVILFNYNKQYKELFAGIGLDKNFYFKISDNQY